ncbi:iron complex transport system permease protein [Clostridium tetanomorphum]|uniref:FecCD family ABC transporter permease n=1 Tax=Clostridium tetanomorphum TaxID=1553 RepID=UPI00044646C7|nr:iron ABC transporter permease [Clostridium tetanomorphum]KAJ51704.1 transporter permease [Clostridium tetanomorphum DSM 665]MBP1865930.1 iron complex transport system permease protein [Clostridium tetanomorphum]NRS86111.1 iron complex transport system permease protein [Clostridium tetanomorphum]SQB89665.1 iron ABC transporter permease [Clostridium tetanomorphum]
MIEPITLKENFQGINIYKQYTRKKIFIIVMLIFTILILSIIAINAGSTALTPYEVLSAILGKEGNISSIVIWRIRLPRILAGIVSGIGLSVAGCVMQNNLRNPLASPSTLGISNAAAFGANIAIVLLGGGSIHSTSADAVNINNPYMVTASAFICSIVATIIILVLAKFRNFLPEAIVLAGVALGSLFSAATTIIQYFAQDVQIAAAVFWSFGDLGRVSWSELIILSFVIGVSLIYFMIRRWDYNALDSGEESAKSLGVNVERVRFESMFISSLITAVCVSFLGIIGFVGLIGPQIMRRIIGGDHRHLIPAAALMGANLILLSDTLARTIISPVVLPVGAITSFLGAPMFLYLLIRGSKKR